MSLYQIRHDWVEQVWPDAAPLISRALEYADGKYTLANILESLKSRDMQLWVAVGSEIDAAGVTTIQIYPGKKVCNLMFVGGKNMESWKGYMEDLSVWAKGKGCDCIEVWGRPGWEKVLGWERIHTVIRKPL